MPTNDKDCLFPKFLRGALVMTYHSRSEAGTGYQFGGGTRCGVLGLLDWRLLTGLARWQGGCCLHDVLHWSRDVCIAPGVGIQMDINPLGEINTSLD